MITVALVAGAILAGLGGAWIWYGRAYRLVLRALCQQDKTLDEVVEHARFRSWATYLVLRGCVWQGYVRPREELRGGNLVRLYHLLPLGKYMLGGCPTQ